MNPPAGAYDNFAEELDAILLRQVSVGAMEDLLVAANSTAAGRIESNEVSDAESQCQNTRESHVTADEHISREFFVLTMKLGADRHHLTRFHPLYSMISHRLVPRAQLKRGRPRPSLAACTSRSTGPTAARALGCLAHRLNSATGTGSRSAIRSMWDRTISFPLLGQPRAACWTAPGHSPAGRRIASRLADMRWNMTFPSST